MHIYRQMCMQQKAKKFQVQLHCCSLFFFFFFFLCFGVTKIAIQLFSYTAANALIDKAHMSLYELGLVRDNQVMKNSNSQKKKKKVMRNFGITLNYATLFTICLCGELWLVEESPHMDPPSSLHQPQLTTQASCGQNYIIGYNTRITL